MLLRGIKANTWYSYLCRATRQRCRDMRHTGAALYHTALSLWSGGWERRVRFKGKDCTSSCPLILTSILMVNIWYTEYFSVHLVQYVWYNDQKREDATATINCKRSLHKDIQIVWYLTDFLSFLRSFVSRVRIRNEQANCNLTEALLSKPAPSDICNSQISR